MLAAEERWRDTLKVWRGGRRRGCARAIALAPSVSGALCPALSEAACGSERSGDPPAACPEVSAYYAGRARERAKTRYSNRTE